MSSGNAFHFCLSAVILALTFVTSPAAAIEEPERKPLNVLLFTADDLNCDSLGCYGSSVPDISPHLDRFAAQSLRFERAHVTVAICQPSRGVLGTGRYPQRSGVMGFMHTERDIPTVMQTFRDAGYLTGILGKVGHSTPHASYRWDMDHDQKELGAGRDPEKYYQYCREFLARCRDDGKPFYFMVNSHDPHRPYHIPGANPARLRGAAEPSRIYKPEEIQVPGFLPDLPGVRKEMSYYFNSVRRLDDTFGRVMQALKESGFEGNTLVMFLSDNGIAVPFAKCNAYLASTRTPWIVRWPGVVKADTIDGTHFVSGIDFLPTALEAAGLEAIKGLDGSSFVPLLKGEKQAQRDHVFTQIDCKAGGDAVPMRCLQDARFGYIFNGWADSEHRYRNNNEGLCMKAMEAAAQTDPKIAERVRMFRYRAVEEFYDLKNDPDCLVNLIAHPEHRSTIKTLRGRLARWMKATQDPLLRAFEKRQSPKEMEDAMSEDYSQWRSKKRSRAQRRRDKKREQAN